MSMVHDNIILSYQVDFENETLTMKTQYHHDTICEDTDVRFTGYLTHIFDDIMIGSIIFDIEEYPLSSFFEDARALLEKRKNAAWPILYETANDLAAYLQSNDYKAFFVTSSLGLCGWVLAKQMDIDVH